MIIVFNPKHGAPINKFVINGIMLDPHKVGEMKQYDDSTGKILLENYGFLQELTPKQAEDILAQPKNLSFKCEYCEYATDKKIGLMGHMRGHQDEIVKA